MLLKVDRTLGAKPMEKRVPGYGIAGGVIYLAIVASIVAAATAAARPIQGYGSLIDDYCISRNRLRVAGHQPHCAMCHQSGTFDNLPAHRVEPNWTEFERGRTSGDFRFFCPGDASEGPTSPVAPSQSAPPQPNPSAAGDPAAAAPLPSPTPMPMKPGPSMTGEMGMGPMRGHGREGGEREGMGPTGNMAQAPPVTSPAPANPAVVPGTPATPQGMATPTIDRPALLPADFEQRLSHFRAEVGIGEAQRPGWDAFAEAVRSAAARRREFASAALPSSAPSGDALTLMQQQERALSARIAALRYVSTAFTRLFAVLDENQRKKANERFSPLLDTL
jgi:hypothetical protein